MDKKSFYKKLKQESEKLNINISENKANLLYTYMKELIDWNKKINLTSIIDEDEIIIKHFIDSLTVLKYTQNKNNLIDIGTGAGFPGIPLAIMNDKLNVMLLDSLNKRIIFLNYIIEKIGLKNVKAIHGRAEDIAKIKNYREKYDIVVSRAVAELNILLEYMLPFNSLNGTCICMKGANIDEIEAAKNALIKLGGKINTIEKISLNYNKINRNLIIINKIKNTPNIYPRKAGTPRKSPL